MERAKRITLTLAYESSPAALGHPRTASQTAGIRWCDLTLTSSWRSGRTGSAPAPATPAKGRLFYVAWRPVDRRIKERRFRRVVEVEERKRFNSFDRQFLRNYLRALPYATFAARYYTSSRPPGGGLLSGVAHRVVVSRLVNIPRIRSVRADKRRDPWVDRSILLLNYWTAKPLE